MTTLQTTRHRGKAVVTAVTLGIGGNGSKTADFRLLAQRGHNARCTPFTRKKQSCGCPLSPLEPCSQTAHSGGGASKGWLPMQARPFLEPSPPPTAGSTAGGDPDIGTEQETEHVRRDQKEPDPTESAGSY